MNTTLDLKSLEQAFQGRADLQGAIKSAASAPAYIELFNQISLHINSLISSSSPTNLTSKKRRLDEEVPSRPATNITNGYPQTNGSSGPASGSDPILLEVKDISVVIPQRKKYSLCFTSSHLYTRLPQSEEPVSGMRFAWKDIEYVFCLPVPEKSQKQLNYILFPTLSTIPSSKPLPGSPAVPDPLVFTIPESAPKPGTISGKEAATASAVSDDYKTLFDWAIQARLKSVGKNVKIVQADEKLFHSMQRQPHRPKEKAVHVKAFRGSKDGFLFFLPNGILWAFKKPLAFIPHSRISAISYTSVLQRTFNLNVEVDLSEADEERSEEIEFSMLDQEDFAEIDGYVKRHGLQDKSMAEQRKAKRENVNVVKDEDGNVVGNAEAGDLVAAAAQAEEDEDDEDEEDYDPGSEGESEGSGTSDEESEGEDEPEAEGGDEEDEDEL
ncbi:hypothetical protein B0O99DRAFT_685960 [Bisporella sp. PMI_857]|nr:hypothetical protein B0O99DRAFT_685960 [Bisporella sp. PMI_857]